MFIVTLLLENLLTWMRKQSGTTSLRALLYFDEIFGYFPPTAEPPSKRPLLTLLKQARAFGLGVVLVTQNPVDIDYKGLTNAGTWFIGKLQAERDKERVLAGLKGALSEAGKGEATDFSTLITRLGNRVFLMHNVNDDGPTVFHTRWALSYLRGPLTLPQVRTLVGKPGASAAAAHAGEQRRPPPPPAEPAQASAPPPAPAAGKPGVARPPASWRRSPPCRQKCTQTYLPCVIDDGVAARLAGKRAGVQVSVKDVQLLYDVGLLGAAAVRFVDQKRSIDEQVDLLLLAQGGRQMTGLDWGRAERLAFSSNQLAPAPEAIGDNQGPFFAELPEGLGNAKSIAGAAKELADWLYYNSQFDLTIHPDLGVFQRPGEDERGFTIRLQQAARERRDAEVDKLREKTAKEIQRVADKIAKEQQELARIRPRRRPSRPSSGSTLARAW